MPSPWRYTNVSAMRFPVRTRPVRFESDPGGPRAAIRLVGITQPFVDASELAPERRRHDCPEFLPQWVQRVLPTDRLGGTVSGDVGPEFQIVPLIAALLYPVFGVHEWIGRGIRSRSSRRRCRSSSARPSAPHGTRGACRGERLRGRPALDLQQPLIHAGHGVPQHGAGCAPSLRALARARPAPPAVHRGGGRPWRWQSSSSPSLPPSELHSSTSPSASMDAAGYARRRSGLSPP